MAINFVNKFSFGPNKGGEVTKIWELDGWGNPTKFCQLQEDRFQFDCGINQNSLNDESLQIPLQFYFGSFIGMSQDGTIGNVGSSSQVSSADPQKAEIHWLSLHVDLDPVGDLRLRHLANPILGLDITIESADDPRMQQLKLDTNYFNPVKTCVLINADRVTDGFPFLIQKEFIKVQKLEKATHPLWKLTEYKRPDNLRLKISVTPIFAFAPVKRMEHFEAVENEGSLLCHDMKNMFLTADDKYTDLNLEMKYGVTLSAHKFILAARSPFLRKLIDVEVSTDDFNGTIKLPEVEAKPMLSILHWMYTEELHENAGNYMEKVVEAAARFELTGMIRLLDQEISRKYCNPDNMFQLYQVVRKNGMVSATANIAKFIKENVSETVAQPTSTTHATKDEFDTASSSTSSNPPVKCAKIPGKLPTHLWSDEVEMTWEENFERMRVGALGQGDSYLGRYVSNTSEGVPYVEGWSDSDDDESFVSMCRTRNAGAI